MRPAHFSLDIGFSFYIAQVLARGPWESHFTSRGLISQLLSEGIEDFSRSDVQEHLTYVPASPPLPWLLPRHHHSLDTTQCAQWWTDIVCMVTSLGLLVQPGRSLKAGILSFLSDMISSP